MIAILLLCLTVLSIKLRGTRSPEFLLVAPWALGFCLSLIFGQSEFLPNQEVFIFLTYFLTEYVLLHMLTGRIKRFPSRNRNFEDDTVTKVLLIIIAAIAIYYVIVSADKLVSSASLIDFLAERRADSLNLEGDLYDSAIFYYGVRISVPAALLAVYLVASSRYSRSMLICTLLIFATMTLANLIDGARSNVIVAFVISSLIIYYRTRLGLIFWISVGFVFVGLFVFSSIIFRQHEEVNLDSIIDGFRYFILYSFGSVESMSYVFNSTVSTYWGDYDSLIRKFFNEDFQVLLGAKSPFIPDYIPAFWDDKSINVYSAYAVYWDYFGAGAVAYILTKTLIISWLFRSMHSSRFHEISYYFLGSTLPLSLFHDYFLAAGVLLLFALVIMFLSQTIQKLLLRQLADC